MVQAVGPVMLGEKERKNLIARARRGRDQYSRDTALLKAKHEVWRPQYADKWIAIYDGEVYGPTKTQDELIRELRAAKVPVPRVVFHYFSSTRTLRIV